MVDGRRPKFRHINMLAPYGTAYKLPMAVGQNSTTPFHHGGAIAVI